MPAGAALSSSSRQRKRQNSTPRPRRASLMIREEGGRGSTRNLMGSSQTSQRNLMGGSQTSQRNLTRDSQRNLMGPQNEESESGNVRSLCSSMPTLRERENSSSILCDSVRTNPELFLTHDFDEGSFSEELRRRKSLEHEYLEKSDRDERGGQENNEQLGESTIPPNNHTAKSSPIKNKDTFNENSVVDSTTPIESNWWPSWMDTACDVRKFTGLVVNDVRVQNTVLLMIMINAIMMGVATFPFVKYNPDLLTKFELADQIFLIIFTIESSMQLLFYGWKLFKDGFLVFDLLIVVVSWALEGTQVFRAFRIFRAIRLITRISTLRNLVSALFSVVPKMTAIFMLLLLIFYIFAVMFTQLFKDMHEAEQVEEPYFSTLYDSMFTLFQMMTLDEWAEILIQIQETYPWAWLPFTVFITLTGFVVVNLIIAVICDAVHVLGDENKAGIHGYDSDSYQSEVNETKSDERERIMISPANTTAGRLEALEQQLNEMVFMQDQMMTTIEMLVKQLRENAMNTTTSIPAESGGRASPSRTWSFEKIPYSRSLPTDRHVENIRGVLQGMADNKPNGAKKVFWKKVFIGTTMSPSIKISPSQFPALQLEDED